MPADLGSAEFTLRADAAELIRAMDQSQKKVSAATAKIAQDLGVSEQAVTKTANKIIAEQDRIAKANAAGAAGFANFAKSAIGFTAAAAGVATGAALINQVFTKVAESTQRATQAQFALNAVYKQATPIVTEFANAQAKNAGRSNTDAQQAIANTRILTQQFGYTQEQIKVIVQRSADLAAVSGETLPEATRKVVAALRLEGDVAESLGLNLQQDAIQASLLTKAERERYGGLDPLTKSQITYTKFLQQSAGVQGEAAKRAGDAAGQQDLLRAKIDNLSVSIGKVFSPSVAAAAGKLADLVDKTTKLVDATSKLPEQQNAAEQSLSELTLAMLRSTGAAGSAAAAYIELQRAAQGVASVSGIQVGPDAGLPGAGSGPTAAQSAAALEGRNAIKRAEAEERNRLIAIAEVRKEVRDAEAKAGIDAAEEEHNREVKALDDKKALLEAERDERRKALEERTRATLDAIETESRAAAEASEAQINRLRAEEEAAKRASSERHDQTLAVLDVEQRAAEAAVDERLRQIELSKEAETRASEETRDAAIGALDAEKRARDAARVEEDRAAEDSARLAKRREDDRHEAAIAGFEAEVEAANDSKDRQLRNLDELAEKAQRQHEQRLRRLSDEADRERDRHDAAIRAIEDEAGADEDRHDRAVRALADQGDAARAAHDAATRAGEDEQRSAKRIHDQRVSQIEDEADAAERTHDLVRRAIDDEADAAERVHDQAIRAIEAQLDAEGERHRRAMSDLDDEQRRRQDAVDQQLDALDALDRATNQAREAERLAGAVESAKRNVQRAESTGNLSEIEEANRALAQAQQAIIDSQAKNARDALRQQLQDQKDAIKDEIDARKAAENEQNRILKDQLDAEKQAANDRLKLTRDELDARKRAADDAYGLIRDELNARRDAAAAAYKLVTDDVAARKLAADDALKVVTDRLERERRAEDDAYKQRQDRRADLKQNLDDQLDDALGRIEAEQRAEDDAYDRTKQRLDERKQAIGDANKDELEKIAARKEAEDDAHDNAVRQAQDQATQEKRAIQDRRTAEDQADRDRRAEIQAAFENEARDRKARYDDEATGEIPALRRALAAAQEHFRQRKLDADAAYDAEQQQIEDTYTHPETGLIPLAQKAAREVQQKYSDMTRDVTAAAKAQKDAIDNEYTNSSKTGLLDYLERARADSQDKLDKQRQYWQAWAEDLAGPNGQIKKVIGRFDELIGRIREAGGTVNVRGGDGRSTYGDSGDDRGGRGPGPGVGSGAVPDPYQVSFPFGARYSNPFNRDIPVHRGVDLTVKGAPNGGKGHPVEAFEDGQVIYNAYDPNGGNGVIIRGDDGLYHRYFHFDATSVRNGQRVNRGEVIGRLGETGTEGSPHLHYEVSRNSGGDPVGDLIDPVPYMSRGGGGRSAGVRTFEFDLFGQHFVFTLPGGPQGEALIRAIEQLGTQIGGRDFGRAAAAIALSEGADGDLARPGTGGARGPFQFDPGGELPHYAAYLHKSLREAGDYAGEYPLEAAAWALKGYLGDALREGLEQHLRGGDLADYGSYYGQRPAGELWRRAGQAHRLLYGYERGGWIDRPTLLVDERTSQPYARAGEGGHPEWVGRVTAGGGDTGPVERQQINVMLGNQTLESISVTGIKLAVRRGLTLSDLGLS